MLLRDFMASEKIDDAAMARRIGGCSSHAVRKWKYGERAPDLHTVARIEEATDGAVTMRDFIDVPPVRPIADRAA